MKFEHKLMSFDVTFYINLEGCFRKTFDSFTLPPIGSIVFVAGREFKVEKVDSSANYDLRVAFINIFLVDK